MAASERQLRRSTKHRPVLNKMGLVVTKIRLWLTHHNLYGIYAKRICVYLSYGVNNVPGFVETFKPVASHERIYPSLLG